MRSLNLFALLSLGLATVLMLWTASLKNAAPATRSVAWLDDADIKLFQNGLVHRHDVLIRINKADVARGYSRSGCDGILLVTQLPNPAQGWQYVAPDVDLSSFSVRYLYKGQTYETTPILKRLRNWLIGTLPGFFAPREPVIGLAEIGHCHLMERALPALVRIGPSQILRLGLVSS